jgi:hypothetical protein
MHRPHHMCLDCGFYKGKQVMDLSSQKAKREARIQAKREAIGSQTGSEAEAVAKAPAVAETK